MQKNHQSHAINQSSNWPIAIDPVQSCTYNKLRNRDIPFEKGKNLS
jgi:hypothetical protein